MRDLIFGYTFTPPFEIDQYTLTPTTFLSGVAIIGGYLSVFGLAVTLLGVYQKYLFEKELKKISYS